MNKQPAMYCIILVNSKQKRQGDGEKDDAVGMGGCWQQSGREGSEAILCGHNRFSLGEEAFEHEDLSDKDDQHSYGFAD